MLYLRKIDIDAWADKGPEDSDSITDLKTSNHELSVWKLKDLASLNSIVLALAMTMSKPISFTAVLIDPDDMNTKQGWSPEIKDQPGSTIFSSMINEHKNFIVENLEHLSLLSTYIHNIINNRQSDKIININEIQINQLLEEQIKSGVFSETNIDVSDKNKSGKWIKIIKELQETLTKKK